MTSWSTVLVLGAALVLLGACSMSRQAVREPELHPEEKHERQDVRPTEGESVEERDTSMAAELRNGGPADYILGSGDTVEISLLRLEEFKAAVTISPSGKLPYYLIGDITAAGLTIFQLRDELQRRLAAYVVNPQILVHITDYRSQKVFALGQVKMPGVYRMRENTELLEALSMAGGTTEHAYLKGAYLVRDGRIVLLNFYDLIQKGATRENIPLLPNDVIFIPDQRDRKVFVLGEVKQPSVVVIQEELSLLEAIAHTGGFTRDANPKAVFLLRGNLSKPEVRKLDVKKVLNQRDPSANIPLQRGDVVYVASSLLADIDHFFQRLSNILAPIIQIERGIALEPLVKEVILGKEKKRQQVIVP